MTKKVDKGFFGVANKVLSFLSDDAALFYEEKKKEKLTNEKAFKIIKDHRAKTNTHKGGPTCPGS